MTKPFLFLLSAVFIAVTAFIFMRPVPAMEQGDDLMSEKPEGYPTAVFAGGCFWCVESEFRALNGVLYTRAGYAGGALANPGYKDITSGQTGHAEVVEVTYDPDQTSFEMLTEFFLTKAHDPTQLNRQGVDVGTQYRSAVFYQDEDQKKSAENIIARLERNNVYTDDIVTKLEPLETFWEAEEYHQQYYEKYEAEHGQPHLRVLLKKGRL